MERLKNVLHIRNEFSVTRSRMNILQNAQYKKVCVKISRNNKLDEIAMLQSNRRCLQRSRSTHTLRHLSPVQPQRRQSMDLSKVRSILKIPNDKPRSLFGRRKTVTFLAQDNLPCANSKTNNQSSQDNENPVSSNSKDDELLIDFSDVGFNEPNQVNTNNAIFFIRDETMKITQTNEARQSMNIQSLLEDFDPLMTSDGAQDQTLTESNLCNLKVVGIFK